jgi:hypothetical protein
MLLHGDVINNPDLLLNNCGFIKGKILNARLPRQSAARSDSQRLWQRKALIACSDKRSADSGFRLVKRQLRTGLVQGQIL